VATPRRASTFHLVFLTYSVICSGAYGLEQMVSASGPGLTILVMIALPIFWAVPLTLTCAELSASHPVEGGYYRWVRLAFGDFVGYQAGWLVWLANLATNAAFAVLFANYLAKLLPGLQGEWRWLAALLLIWATTLLNYLGIRLVGITSVVLTVILFLPFLFMTLLGIVQWRYNPLVPFAPPGMGVLEAFGASLMIAVWLYSGYEKLTTNAGEVENPSRAFPIALGIAVPMAVLSYLIPTVVGLAACDDWSHWEEAHFSVLARTMGGPALGVFMTFGGLLSNICLLMVTILGQSRLPMVMAEDRLFPAAFGRVSRRFGTPVVSLLTGAVLLSLLSREGFTELTGLFSLVQVLAYCLIYAALLRLRRREPAAGSHAGRFRIPLGNAALLLMMVPSFLITGFVVVERFWNAGVLDLRRLGLDLLAFASGPLTYLVFSRRKSSPERGPTPTGDLSPGV
jgi:amino acid transporter